MPFYAVKRSNKLSSYAHDPSSNEKGLPCTRGRDLPAGGHPFYCMRRHSPPHMRETPGHSWIINQEPLGILGNNKVVSSRDEVATFARAITIYDVASGPAQEES